MRQAQPKKATRTVTFKCDAPNAHFVAIAGDFNQWDSSATPLSHVSSETWQIKLRLTSGVHEFKYVVDGQWCCEPGVDDHYCESSGETVDNPFGTKNRVVRVG
jgi:1,4-alpha-glucan branching enzyme